MSETSKGKSGKAVPQCRALTIRVGDVPFQKLSRKRRNRWKSILDVFGYGFEAPFIIFLAEMLSVFTGKEARFSGSFSDQGYGTGEEHWSVTAGGWEIFRGRRSELCDGWQRVEVQENRTTLSGFPEGRSLEWDGEYGLLSGMKLELVGVTREEEVQLRKIADELFGRVEISPSRKTPVKKRS